MNSIKEINKHLQDILPTIIDVRRKLHQIPELCYEEHKTSALIAETLESYGLDVIRGVANTGIVAVIDSGKPGKIICLRADMDALEIEEPVSNEYTSQHAGRMHACGHDGHCATLLAVAYILSRMKNEMSGKVKFIFQPAEEGGKGSTAMIEAGVLKDPRVDEIYGFHNWPGLEEGVIATKPGAVLLGNGRIEITVKGKSAHTAQPENAINPVTIGAELVSALDEVGSSLREKNIILNIFSFNSGEFKKGMSEKVEIVGVYYIESFDELEFLKQHINTIIKDYSERYRTEIFAKITPFHSPTINTKSEANNIIKLAKELFGENKVIELDKSMIASEDFSEYLRHVPGCFFLVGAGKRAASVHTSKFIFNDEIIAVAAKLLVSRCFTK